MLSIKVCLLSQEKKRRILLQLLLCFTCSPGSVGVEYVATFNKTDGVNDNSLKTELAGALNVTNNGTFLADSDLQLSEETDPAKAIEALQFSGKVIYDVQSDKLKRKNQYMIAVQNL